MNDKQISKWRRQLYDRRGKIAERLKTERGKMSQTELANKLSALLGCEVAQSTISSWEQGKTIPPVDRVLALSHIFQCDCGYLLGDYDERTHNTLEMCRETGLSEASINNLCFLNQWGLTETAHVIDFLLFDSRVRYPGHNYRSVLNLLNFFLSYKGNQNVQKQVFTNGAIVDYTDTCGTISTNAIRLNERIIENAVLAEIQQALISIKRKMAEGTKGEI